MQALDSNRATAVAWPEPQPPQPVRAMTPRTGHAPSQDRSASGASAAIAAIR